MLRGLTMMPNPKSRPRNISDEDWDALLAEKKAPVKGRGEPMNVLRRPMKLPPMERIKEG